MPSLSSLALPGVMDTSSHDLVRDFFAPVLACAQRYDRGVGFFSSSWLRINARGMLAFAGNGGRARWVTSPILEAADWEALQLGDAARADAVLRQALERSSSDLSGSLDPQWLRLIVENTFTTIFYTKKI
jgi:hypothetical protein